jgi:hypothetical protein
MPSDKDLILGFLDKSATQVAKQLYSYTSDRAYKLIAAYVKKASQAQVTATINEYIRLAKTKDLREQQTKQRVLEIAMSGTWDKSVFPLGETPRDNKRVVENALAAWKAPDLERARVEGDDRRAALVAAAAAAAGPAAAGAGPLGAALLAQQQPAYQPPTAEEEAAAAAQARADEEQDEEEAAQEAANTSETGMALGPSSSNGSQTAEDPKGPNGGRRRKTKKSRKGKKRTTRRAKKTRKA